MKYDVTFSYRTYCTVTVEAESEEEAIQAACEGNADDQLLENLEIVSTEVEEI